MERCELITYLDQFLSIHAIEDYGPQGLQLQVEAKKRTINRIALAVDVAPQVIEAAAAWPSFFDFPTRM